ncbi:uncharacterized protein LOC120850815, partial [Ixodes scapularis]|uniref:uncharacterized protein LOC120850815 n=1 Tax=Ixodes scapularis TaxID=6945 RepID=UPI001A9E04F4
MAHYRAINSSTSSANTELSSQSLPSTIAVHISDSESHTREPSAHSDSEPAGSESPPGGTYDDDDDDDELYSSSDEEHSADDTETADGGQYVDENIPPPDAMSEEEFLAAGLREFGSETLPHSTTTKAEAVALMMSFLSANGLSWKGLDDLVKMGNIFFAPAADVFPRSKYLFRKLWGSKTEKLVEYHYYCNSCSDLLSSRDGMDSLFCPTCEEENKANELKRSGAFFVTLKMHEQLKQVISQTKAMLHDSLTSMPSSEPVVIAYITSATTHCQLWASGRLGACDLTLTVNTDGSPVFSSSGASIWPIQFTVNELPVPQRFEHCTLAGLWFGKGHPNMALFLNKFVEDINSMEPVVWEHQGTRHSSRAFVICFSLNAPARSAVQNCVLFNGYFGCPWCLIKGDYIEGCVRYINSSDSPDRTTEGVLRDMALGLECSVPINGYKGPSPTVKLPHFDLVWGFTVDYMHGVLLGVTRQITEELLTSSNSQKRYYI